MALLDDCKLEEAILSWPVGEADLSIIDIQHRASLYHSHIAPTVHLASLQALARVLLRWLWAELHHLRHSWPTHQRLGCPTGTHVPELDGMDGHV